MILLDLALRAPRYIFAPLFYISKCTRTVHMCIVRGEDVQYFLHWLFLSCFFSRRLCFDCRTDMLCCVFIFCDVLFDVYFRGNLVSKEINVLILLDKNF